MPYIPYNRNIPNPPDNPSNNVADMQENTNSIDDLIREDHYSFEVSNGGLHRQVRLVDLLSLPGPLSSGIGTLYTKLATSTFPSTESDLFFTPDNSTNEYQLTRTITASFPRFASGAQYQAAAGPTPALFGGWTFLPGGMLLQYGTFAHTTNQETTLTFPVPFTGTPFCIQASGIISASADPNQRAAIGIRAVSSTGFIARTTTNADLTGIYWLAIGI